MDIRIARLILPLSSMLILWRCAGVKEVPYSQPTEAQAKGNLHGDFAEQFERGRVLYSSNCGGCHNVKVGGRMIIPDFSMPQLLDYEMRMQYPAHGERLRESNVSAEELDDIQVFLQYRKPSGYPVAPLPVQQAPSKVN